MEVQVELHQFGITDMSLLDGERIDSALNLAADGGDSTGHPEVMLLTGKRIIHIHGNGRRRKAAFASIQDIDGVEVGVEPQGTGAYIWAALAFIAAVLLYFAIDHSAGRIAGAVVVALFGAYLIVDHMVGSGRQVVIFKAGSSRLSCDLNADRVSEDVYPFINRLFQLKAEQGPDGLFRTGPFSPR